MAESAGATPEPTRQFSKGEMALALAINVLGGIVTYLLVSVLTRFEIVTDPIWAIVTSLVLVALALVIYVITRKPHGSFGFITVGVLLGCVAILWSNLTEAPDVVRFELTDAKVSIEKAGLRFEAVEMVQGGTQDVSYQQPEAGALLFRKSLVKVFYGERPSVTLAQPMEDESIPGHRVEVRGTSVGVRKARDFRLYVVVKTEDNNYWVQHSPEWVGSTSASSPDDSYSVTAFLGEPDAGRGATFRLLAIVTAQPLKAGSIGTELPRNVAKSQTVKVTRKD